MKYTRAYLVRVEAETLEELPMEKEIQDILLNDEAFGPQTTAKLLSVTNTGNED